MLHSKTWEAMPRALHDHLSLRTLSGRAGHLRHGVKSPLLASLVLVALTLTACGPVPRPFHQDDKVSIDLRAPSTRSPLRVSAPEGDAPGNPRRFALHFAENLLERGIAAEPDWFSLSGAPPLEIRRMTGTASVGAANDGNERVELAWHLLSPDGRETPLAPTQLLLPAGAWESGDEDSLADAAEISAASVARALGAMPGLERSSDAAPNQRLVLLPIEGAPGDGAESLERAILRALGERDVPLAALPEEQDLLLWCEVAVSEPRGPWQYVEIRWRLERAADFSEIGTVTQENRVPMNSLVGPWRDAAVHIAEAAADGITDLLLQAGLSAPDQP